MSQASNMEPAQRYTAELAGQIETAWQDRWDERGTFNADNPVGEFAGPLAEKKPFFLLDMFPYPSGKGLHVGHPLGYIATDTVARFRRMQGENVLYTMGYDAFGLPAEQYAVQTGQHPRITTEENIANMRRQLRRLGLSHDRRRSLATTDTEYVHWTQWIFLQIFNSWFDPEATAPDGSIGAARPIAELEEKLANGQVAVPDGRNWADLDAVEKAKVVNDFRLVYVSEAPVNWCPGLGTVLANEEVTSEGRSERGNYPVFKRNLRQWMMRITAYGKRLADDLDTIDWPDKVRTMQRNWIGRSEGATVRFDVPVASEVGASVDNLEVYTTRPDTLFGATFMVVAPEHPILGGTVAGNDDDEAALTVPASWPEGTKDAWTDGAASPREAVARYRAQAAGKSETERADEERTKTGVFTGLYGIDPVNGHKVPVFVADYVLWGYGTGAIMAVPAHDDRDWEFANKYELDIVRTIGAADDPYGHDFTESAYTGDGVAVDSANDEISLNGLAKDEAKAAMIEWLESKGLGRGTVTYRLRDWLFSRQRYWGEPFPIVWDEDGLPHALPEDQLPVELPEVSDYSPRTFGPDDANTAPEAPLGRSEEWVNVTMDLGDGPKNYRRETNTMPQWAGSCWYEMRYTDPKNSKALASAENLDYWMGPREGKKSGGTDLYVGGVEHAVLHLLYSRFWQKVLFDLGHVPDAEPYHTLFNQGYVQAYAFKDERGQYVPADEIEGDEATGFTYQGQPVTREYGKMGKSLKNIVTPDEMYDAYGADVFRVYEMSMGPLDVSRPWETRAVVGSQRFLQRLWRNTLDEETGEVTVTDEEADLETKRLVARTIADVTVEYENMRVNTAVSKLIVLNNHLTGLKSVPREAIEPLVLMISPVAPHIAEELWMRLGHGESLAREPFPVVTDESLLVEESVTAIVQVNGKVRARLEVSPSISEEDLRSEALAQAPIVKALEGREPLKVIVRKPSLVNVVLPR
ncbi:leucine-tRNA ligase [Schaalia turicensis ACS-279-V-Col4]|uniref:Leucine--tRNA ligase n=1 Tax=Schaalia turicensis ACS-279-V-Col4 TaxID=883077 RepID=K0YS19_9ACTO|nr:MULTISPECIES: class I tRNA ligase family protein [Actinomycetaceae]MDK7781558.1 class I tRNA ligase family protein [Actinomycetaceae bacterium UMB8041B]MDK8294452.1 class I tRNA ligase family protein [Actinomycetaceae bacterium UMB8039B]MDK8609277.1 class I tRNA ligase family protein [Actinomycetaceae bacterium UMB8041A]MDK8753864.1 class I tRNA ligase family protein [Actinomycetaceae bacterium UMB8039A]EJZ86406.1 leucine-tRNA ligase [Schaalia turicensis ACS-279-V-Col4]